MGINFMTLTIAALVLAGCATKETVQSDIAPAAKAVIRASKTDNNNTKLEVNVKHLAEPERLAEGADHYVVWVTPRGAGNPMNVGSINVDNNLRGELETTVPYSEFQVTVTAEKNRLVVQPSGPEVFAQHVKR